MREASPAPVVVEELTVWGKPVTVLVKKNTFVYTRRHSDAHGAHCLVAHMADGSSVRLPDVPCP